jgi:hypothetical protein
MTFKTGGKLLSTLQEPTPTTIFNLLEHRVFSSWKSGLHDRYIQVSELHLVVYTNRHFAKSV